MSLVAEQLNDVDMLDERAALLANDFIQEVGELVVSGWQAEAEHDHQKIDNLLSAVKRAHSGDPVAHKMVETNVTCDVVERAIKAGFILEVELEVDEEGNILQHGQTLEDIQANSLNYASKSWQMRERVEAETRNSFKLKGYLKGGYLKDHCMVVVSRAADNMTEKEMARAGFFTGTMSCVIQVTTIKNGKLTVESAFVAGLKDSDGQRQDKEAIKALGDKLGIDFGDFSATDTLNKPRLVAKSKMPNGVIDLVEMFDESVDERTGSNDTFFGEAKGKEDYALFRQECKVRQERFRSKIKEITNDLISQAAMISTPIEAVKLLHKLSEEHMVEYAVYDHSINPDVFGFEASLHIEMARWHSEMGNEQQAQEEILLGKLTAKSSACPSGFETDEDSETASESDEDCEYTSKECPLCGAKNVKTTVSKISRTEKRITGSCGCSKTVKSSKK